MAGKVAYIALAVAVIAFLVSMLGNDEVVSTVSYWYEGVAGDLETLYNVTIHNDLDVDGNLNVAGANTYLTNLYLDGNLYGDLGILSVGDNVDAMGNDIFNLGELCFGYSDCTTTFSGLGGGFTTDQNDELNTSGTPTFDGMNITGTLRYYNLSSVLDSVIDITYRRSATVASAFKYDVGTDPTDVSNSNRILTVSQVRLNSPTDRTGKDFIFGNYVFAGEDTDGFDNGSKDIIWDYYKISLPDMAYPVTEIPSNDIDVGHHYVELNHPIDLSFGNSGTQDQYGGWVKYNGKANNVFGGSRTYDNWAYRGTGFTGCQSYDQCYAFWADNSDSWFDGSVILTSGDKVCLDGSTCNFYLYYNGTCIYSSGSGNCV